MIGINPDLFTLRELVWMAEGKGRENWNHTAALLATMINIMRSKNRPVVKPSELNPYLRKPRPMLRGSELIILKDIFVKEENHGIVK